MRFLKHMWIKPSFFLLLTLLIFSILGSSFSQQSASQTPAVEELGEPPWVLSDSLCQLLNIPSDAWAEISEADKKKATKDLMDAFKLVQQYNKSKDIQLLFEAQPLIENAIKMSRDHKNTQRVMNGIYGSLEQFYIKQKDYRAAIRLGERRWRLNSENKSNYSIYYLLGQSYMQIDRLEYAFLNFQKAEKYLPNHMLTARSKEDTTAIKRFENNMFNILRCQAMIYEEWSRPDDVMKVVEKAVPYATDDRKNGILNYFRIRSDGWLFWEDREAMETELDIRRFVNNKQLDEAQGLYEKLLLKFPTITEKQRVEVERLFAGFEYRHLGKKVQAIERLLPWVLGRDSLKQIENIQHLYNDFSQMCLAYGIEQLDTDRFAAYCYYKQGLLVPSDFHESIIVRLLNLCVWNTAEFIRQGSELWVRSDRLTDVERRWLCEQLIYAYKKTGDPEATRRFLKEYRQL